MRCHTLSYNLKILLFKIKREHMIQAKLLLLESVTGNDRNIQDQMRLQAIREIKNLLMQIDFNAEVVPTENSNKLKELLVSLKGSQLTKSEDKLVNELVEN